MPAASAFLLRSMAFHMCQLDPFTCRLPQRVPLLPAAQVQRAGGHGRRCSGAGAALGRGAWLRLEHQQPVHYRRCLLGCYLRAVCMEAAAACSSEQVLSGVATGGEFQDGLACCSTAGCPECGWRTLALRPTYHLCSCLCRQLCAGSEPRFGHHALVQTCGGGGSSGGGRRGGWGGRGAAAAGAAGTAAAAG